jgi:hypothetical protein
VKYSFQNLFEVVLECFIHHIMWLMAAIFDGGHKKERLLVTNSYLGNICPFPLVTRNIKEELNMPTTPD